MSQYNSNSSSPKIRANSDAVAKDSKKLEQKVKLLTDQVEEQQRLIDRMHRDIVRLRVAINEVSVRIK